MFKLDQDDGVSDEDDAEGSSLEDTTSIGETQGIAENGEQIGVEVECSDSDVLNIGNGEHIGEVECPDSDVPNIDGLSLEYEPAENDESEEIGAEGGVEVNEEEDRKAQQGRSLKKKNPSDRSGNHLLRPYN